MERISISAEETLDRVMAMLKDRFPGVVFAIRTEEPRVGRRDLHGVDLVWIDGPAREIVEDAIDRFQGTTWDPRTGVLESRPHFQVGPDGGLQQICYAVDYVFCDGPTSALFNL